MERTTLDKNLLVHSFRNQISDFDLDSAINTVIKEKKSYLAVSFSIGRIDLLAALEQVTTKSDFQFYWEKPSEDFSIAAAGELHRIVHKGESRFRGSSTDGKKLLAQVHHLKGLDHRNAEVHLFGGFSFFEDSSSRVWENFEAASFTLPKWMIIKEGKCTILVALIPIEETDSTSSIKARFFDRLETLYPICNVDEYRLVEETETGKKIRIQPQSEFELIHWVETVNRAKKSIHEGTFEKVVLARQLVINQDNPASDTLLLHKLRKQYPDCYCFLIRQNERASFIGCSPERLASFEGSFILTEGLAGSTSRGKTASEDAILEKKLLNSTKDLHEHEIVLDAIEQKLSPYSKSISHPDQPGIKKLSNVQHLYTPITATIHNGVSRTEVLKDLHPTPAVGGYPRKEAVKFIQKHEDFDRGWYAAPIGWINTSGNSEFAVAIRSGLILQNEVRFFAGCGIVQDSDPYKEWEETNMKFIPMLTALEYAGS